MSKAERDPSILERIVEYCKGVLAARERFGDSADVFLADYEYRLACSMLILQIGELSTHLSEDFRAAHGEIPWRAVKNMRNIIVHEYSDVDFGNVWRAMTVSVPALQAACEVILDGLHD